MTGGTQQHEIGEEQAQVTLLYDRLDVLRERAAADLRRILGEQTTGTDQALGERESLTSLYSRRHTQLSSVERGLCFGRVDNADESRENGAARGSSFVNMSFASCSSNLNVP